MKTAIVLASLLMLLATACADGAGTGFETTGTLQNRSINEASGLQAGRDGVFFVHNDEKRDVFVIDSTGRHLGAFKLDKSDNRDWEDIARVPGPDGPLLVIGDIGDNARKRKEIALYFFAEPEAGAFDHDHEAIHRVKLRYPDGPRDAESMAYDAAGGRILILSKRDRPPRLYAVPLDRALSEKKLEAEFLAEVPGFRPPDQQDLLRNPGRGMWVSQPTGMDIAPDGLTAAVITYRSLYLFRRAAGEDWALAFQSPPRETIGPPGTYEEAVAFSADGRHVYVTTERRPAPVHRILVPREQ